MLCDPALLSRVWHAALPTIARLCSAVRLFCTLRQADHSGRAIRPARAATGRHVHRTSAYRNNGLEQDHRGVKGRIRCMRGFKSFASAERFCRSHDELRDFLRPRTRHNQHVPADLRRRLHLRRATAALATLVAA